MRLLDMHVITILGVYRCVVSMGAAADEVDCCIWHYSCHTWVSAGL